MFLLTNIFQILSPPLFFPLVSLFLHTYFAFFNTKKDRSI